MFFRFFLSIVLLRVKQSVNEVIYHYELPDAGLCRVVAGRLHLVVAVVDQVARLQTRLELTRLVHKLRVGDHLTDGHAAWRCGRRRRLLLLLLLTTVFTATGGGGGGASDVQLSGAECGQLAAEGERGATRAPHPLGRGGHLLNVLRDLLLLSDLDGVGARCHVAERVHDLARRLLHHVVLAAHEAVHVDLALERGGRHQIRIALAPGRVEAPLADGGQLVDDVVVHLRVVRIPADEAVVLARAYQQVGVVRAPAERQNASVDDDD